MKDFLKHLNKEQYEAATTINGPLLIIAGAGSGKTMTLVSRIANMIDEGIDPSSILLLTFTNQAAKEMKNRIEKSIGEAASKVTASTFHSFCATFLRRYCNMLAIDNNFTIIDSADATEAMGIARDEFVTMKKEQKVEYDAKSFPTKKNIIGIYSQSVNNCRSLIDVVSETRYSNYYTEIKEIIDRYVMYKKEHSLLDYDDLLLHTQTILKIHKTIRLATGNKYKYVCCDEYQDTNILQDNILNLICEEHRNLAVVGDDNQSIYKFRGSRIENILSFDQRYPECKSIILNQNYRSSQEILDLSNAVMKYAYEGIPKTLNGQFNGLKPHFVLTETNRDENYRILNEIQRLHSEGIPYKEMAVIERSSSQSYELETILNQNGIPFNKYGGIKFFEKTTIRDIICFLRIIVNEKDEIDLYRILQLYPGIGKCYSSKITEAVSKDGINILNTIFNEKSFHQYLKELHDTLLELGNMELEEQLEYLLTDYYPEITTRTIDLSQTNEGKKLEEKNKLARDIKDASALYSLAEGYTTAKKFLEDMVLEATVKKSQQDAVNITTIHSAKGLEYDIVFIMDAIEGFTPQCEKDSDEESEELRCFYVALTRARKELYIFVPKNRVSPPFRTRECYLSHFLDYDDVLDCFASVSKDTKNMRKWYS